MILKWLPAIVELLTQEPQAVLDFRSLHLKVPDAKMVRRAIQLASGEPRRQEMVQEEFLTGFILSAQTWTEEKIPGLFRDR